MNRTRANSAPFRPYPSQPTLQGPRWTRRTVHSSLTGKVKTRKTELLFLVLMLRCSSSAGGIGVIVPDGVLFGSLHGPSRPAADAGGRQTSSRGDQAPGGRVPALRRRFDRRAAVHEGRQDRPCLVLRRANATASAWTTSGPRCPRRARMAVRTTICRTWSRNGGSGTTGGAEHFADRTARAFCGCFEDFDGDCQAGR